MLESLLLNIKNKLNNKSKYYNAPYTDKEELKNKEKKLENYDLILKENGEKTQFSSIAKGIYAYIGMFILILVITHEIFLSFLLPLFFSIGLVMYLHQDWYKRYGHKIKGVIIDRIYSRSDNGGTYRHTIKYKINDIEYEETERMGRSKRMNIGSEIIIFINPYNFSKFKINHSFDKYFSLFFMIFSLIFLTIFISSNLNRIN